MGAILSIRNRSILASKNITARPPCNCRRKVECPLHGNCRKKAIIYKASISTDGNDLFKSYYDCCEAEFKSRFYNHRQTFKNKQKRYTTELLKVFWGAIDNGKDPRIEWSIKINSNTYQPGAARYNLSLEEKLAILLADSSSMLTKTTKLNRKYRHKNKFNLKNVFVISLSIEPDFFHYSQFLHIHTLSILRHFLVTRNLLTSAQLRLINTK